VSTYLLKRLALFIPTMALVLLFIVVLVRVMPGNVIDAAIADQSQLNKVDRRTLEHRLGLDQPIYEQYATYAGQLLRGNLGRSLWTGRTVLSMIGGRAWITAELTGIALVMALLVAFPVGILSALRENSVLDYLLRSFTVIGLTVPEFMAATLVLVLPAVWFAWTPMLYHEPSRGLPAHVQSLLLPAGILAMRLATSLARLIRTMMLEVMRQDFIRTARAKGVSRSGVLMRHALRNALIPVVTLLAIDLVWLISGAVIVERIFGVPGLGDLLLTAVSNRDYAAVQGITVLIGLFVLALNLVVDMSYGWLDPRVRVGS
jgi:peptide/nickel transport system permease protein